MPVPREDLRPPRKILFLADYLAGTLHAQSTGFLLGSLDFHDIPEKPARAQQWPGHFFPVSVRVQTHLQGFLRMRPRES